MYDVIIIGAGPAGISMAVEARMAEIPAEKVLIIEKAHEHSFSIKRYYPENKVVTANYKGFDVVCTGTMCIPDLTKKETISYLDDAINTYQLNVHYSEGVWKIEQHEIEKYFTIYTDKSEYSAKIIVIAIGILGKPNKPEYSLPTTLKDRLLFDVTSIEITNAKVLIVGGGDSASEYCQYLVEKKNEVSLSYRQTEFERMNRINKASIMALAERNELRMLLGTNIESIAEKDNSPFIKFKGTELSAESFDYVVFALGGTTPHNFLKTIGIEFNGKDPILHAGYETSVPGMFLVGDLTAGTKGGSIIWAFNSANTAMEKISDKYLNDPG